MEFAGVAFAAVSALALAFSNLGVPSLWHDELIHVYVGKKIIETGLPLLLSGRVFTNGTAYNYLLAGVIAAFGDGEVAVRSIAAVFGVINILSTYRLLRPLIGAPAAVLAMVLMAWSPWQLAWARQARFYMLHQTTYLVIIACVMRYVDAGDRRATGKWAMAIVAAYVAGLLAGPQTIFFLGPIGVYATCLAIAERRLLSKHTALLALCGVLGACTLLGYYLTLPKAEHDAIFREALRTKTQQGALVDHDQTDSLYYFRFFTNNLGIGFFALAVVGAGLLLARGDRRGLLVLLAFVVPLLVLNYGIPNHRRYRFLFFAYPFYTALCAYAIVRMTAFAMTARRSAWRAAAAAVLVLFAARVGLTQARLVGDCIDVARGSSTTLAVHHPAWREPCTFVRDRLDGAAVVCTTYIAALHYIGRVDNWYPSRVIVWEYIESGMEGMRTLEELQAFVRAHPRGFFVAEHRRFHMWPFFRDDLAWVEANMQRVDEASNEDITVYAWGGAVTP